MTELTQRDASPLGERIWAVPLPLRYGLAGLGAVLLCFSAWLSFQRNLDFAWTSVRLAPAFALTHGYPLFSSAETPPWVMVGYGPLYPVAYLPSTVAATPAAAVAIGTFLAHLYILLPAALLCAASTQRLRRDDSSPGLHWSILLLFFALIAYMAPSLTYITTNVHVDAPALGLFLLACYSVLKLDETDGGTKARWLLIAGACAGLSAACKLNLLSASLAFFIWIAWLFGVRAAVRFAVCAAAAFGAVYLLAIARDGFGAVLLNLRLPGRMPWFTLREADSLTLSGSSYDLVDKLRTFLTILSDYLRHYGIIGLAVVLALPAVERTSRSAANMVRFLLFLTLVMLAASIASVGKSGGDVNSRALVTLPLAIAALVAFAALVQQPRRFAIATAYLSIGAAVFIVALSAAANFLRWSVKSTSTMVEAYDAVAKEPGRWYFPFDPLAHLLAEGKFRPNMDVVHSYAVAGSPVDRAAFRDALPADLQHIAVPPAFASWGIAEIRRLLPEYGRAARELDLEHHNVIAR